MKTKHLILTPLIAAVTLVGCSKSDTPTTPTAAAPTADKAAAIKPYPLPTCLVSGEKLGSMGEPVVMVHQGQEIKFCCKSCKPDFEKDPAKYLSKLSK
jgi:YHS domain-containing protein